MNDYLVIYSIGWTEHKAKVQATTRKYAEGQIKNKNKNATIERCVKVGCQPVKVVNTPINRGTIIKDDTTY
jgi:hypothetical protein